MTIRPIFAWYDLWIGAFWDRSARKLYILPLPCIGMVVAFESNRRRGRMDADANMLIDYIVALKAEIERLRTVLKEIQNNGYRAALCHAVAKTALEQNPLV